MKKLLLLIILALGCVGVSFGQVEDTPSLVAKASISQSGGGAGYWQVSGNMTDESGFFDASAIAVGDFVFFTDGGFGYHLPITNIVSVLPPSFVVQVNNTGITNIVSVPTTLGAIYRASPNQGLMPYTSGVTNPDQQTLINYLIQKIDNITSTTNECLDTIDITGITPTPVVGSAMVRTAGSWDNISGYVTTTAPDGIISSVSGSVATVVYCGSFATALPSGGYYADSTSTNGYTQTTPSGYVRPLGHVTEGFYIISSLGSIFGSGSSGGSSATNLSFVRDATTVTVNSDTGTDAVLPAATSTNAGVLLAADKAKLDTLVNTYTDTPTLDFTRTGTDVTGIVKPASLDSTHIKVGGMELEALSQDGATTGQVLGYNGTNWVPSDIDPANVDMVRDSALMRAYNGDASILIMEDADRGGMFKICVTCTADEYMVFTDALARKWERFNYGQVLVSWWGRNGHVSLQRAINYVGTTGITEDKTVGTLHINYEVTIRDSVILREGVRLQGISPTNIDGTHPADSPAKNPFWIDLNDATKNAIVWEDNARAYSINTSIVNIAFRILTPCAAVLDMKEPYKGTLSNVFIGPNTGPRNFDYAIKVTGSVVCNWDNLHIQGAKKAGIVTYNDDIAGTTINISDSYITRCNIGILDQANVGFWLDNVHPENIDSIFVWTNQGVRLVNSRAENTPLATNGAGAFIHAETGAGEVYVNNVEIGGSTPCSLAVNCPILSGGARQTTISNALAISFQRVADIPAAFKFVTLDNVRLSSVETPDSAFLKHPQVQTWNLQQYSGGSLANSINYINADIRPNKIIDQSGNVGGDKQYLKVTGTGNLDWGNLAPSELIQEGAITDDVLTWDGVQWYPQALPVVSTPNLDAAYNAFGPGASIINVDAVEGQTGGLVFQSTGTNDMTFKLEGTGDLKIFDTAGEADNIFTDQGRVGFGISTPNTKLHVRDNSSSVVTVDGSNNVAFVLENANTNPNLSFTFKGALGNLTTPLALTAEKPLGSLIFQGHNGTNYSDGAKVYAKIDGTPSGGNLPTELILSSRHPSLAVTDRMWIKASGKIGLGEEFPTAWAGIKSVFGNNLPILSLRNASNDSTHIWLHSATTPNGNISATQNDVAFTYTGTEVGFWHKRTGTGNTGWTEYFNKDKQYAATLGQYLAWNGTTWTPSTITSGATTVGATTAPTANGASITGSTLNIAQADATNPGIIQLAGDLTGTYSAPDIAADAVTTAEILDLTIATADLANSAVTTGKIQNGTILFDDWSQNAATISGQYPVWNQTLSVWELNAPVATTNLDAAYNNFGATASTIVVDAAEGQTGGLNINLATTEDFAIQDNGTNVMQVADNGYSSFGLVAPSTAQRVLVTEDDGGTVTVPVRVRNGGARQDGGGVAVPLNFDGADQAMVVSYDPLGSYANETALSVRIGGTLQPVMVVNADLGGETRFNKSVAYEIQNITATTDQITGLRSLVNVPSTATTTTITLPEIVAIPTGPNQVRPGYVFTLSVEQAGVVTINRAGSSDLIYTDGVAGSATSFSTTGGIYFSKKIIAMENDKWSICQ